MSIPDDLIEPRVYLPWPTRSSLWPTFAHVLYLLPSQVYSLLLDDRGIPVACTGYRNTGRLSEDMFLRFLFEKESTLRQPYLTYRVVIGDAPFFLLPEGSDAEADHLALARTLLDDATMPDEVRVSPSPAAAAYAVYTLDPARRHLLDHYLSQYELLHLSYYAIQTAHRLANQAGDALTMILTGKQVLITALRAGELRLCNQYPYAEPLEAIYFLQSVRNASGLDQGALTGYVMGETNPADLSPASLWHHLQGLQTPPLSAFTNHPLPEGCPHWRFLFLTH